MPEPLRPLSTGELLDRTFTLYRRNFILFVGIAALAPAIYLALQAVFVGTTRAASTSAARSATAFSVTAGITVLVGAVAWMLGLALTQAATIRGVAAVHLGQSITIGEAYRGLRGRYGRILGVFFSVAIRVFGGAFVLVVAAVALGAGSVAGGSRLGVAGGVIGALVALVAAVAAGLLAVTLFVRYSLAVQACVVEDIAGKEALRRSVILTKGSRGRVLTVYTLFIVLTWVISVAVGLLTMGIAAALRSAMAATILAALGSFVAGALSGPLVTIGVSLLYFDERVRKEAFDLQLMMNSLGGELPAGPSVEPA